jgi:hypothetical protein
MERVLGTIGGPLGQRGGRAEELDLPGTWHADDRLQQIIG